jgi:hypothetical protein
MVAENEERDSLSYWARQMRWALLDVWSAHVDPAETIEFEVGTLGEAIERGARIAAEFEAYVYRRQVKIDLARPDLLDAPG